MSSASADVVVKLAPLRGWIVRLLVKQGMYEADAQLTAQRLVESELLGRPAGGLQWLTRLWSAIDLGDVDPRAQLVTLTDLPALAVIDGGTGVGQVAVTRAVELGVKKARVVGAAVVVVRNSRPIGDPAVFLAVATSSGCLAGVMSACKHEREPWPIGACTVWGWPGRDSPLITSSQPPQMADDLFAGILPAALCGKKTAALKKRLFADDAEHVCFLIDLSRCNSRDSFEQVAGQAGDNALQHAPAWVFDSLQWPETAEISATTVAELRELATAARVATDW